MVEGKEYKFLKEAKAGIDSWIEAKEAEFNPLPANVVSIFGYKRAQKSQQTDTIRSFAEISAEKVKADRKASNAQVIKELKNGKNNKGAV